MRPVALITGASSGIGAAVSEVLATRGYDLVVVARRRNRLDSLAEQLAETGATVDVLAADLSDRAGLRLAADRAGAGDIDLLISNAGVSAYGSLAELDPVELDRAWTLNADATPLLIRAALPGMLERGRGGIITVASNLAFSAGISSSNPGGGAPQAGSGSGRSMPKRTLYVGAKAGIVAFTRTLADELLGTGVHAMVVCPGLVSSEWNGGASQGPLAMTPEDVATAIWSGFAQREIVCLPGLEDTARLDAFAEAERRIIAGNIGPQLASRYRS